MDRAPIPGVAAEEGPQIGDPGVAENDRNPNPIGDQPIEYEDGFIPWVDVNLPDVHRRKSALHMPSPVIEGAP